MAEAVSLTANLVLLRELRTRGDLKIGYATLNAERTINSLNFGILRAHCSSRSWLGRRIRKWPASYSMGLVEEGFVQAVMSAFCELFGSTADSVRW